jgi:DNA-binding NarL/FixJ family response regulator
MRIRVLLAQMAPMLQDIVRDAVTNEPDVEVVGSLAVREQFLPVLDRLGVDVLVLAAPRADDAEVAERVWEKWPHIKVLMIATGGRSAVLHALRPHRIMLGDVSPQGLVAAIRGDLAGTAPP